MARYEYKARNAQGEAVEGLIDADSIDIATDTLRDRGLFVLSVVAEEKTAFNLEIGFLTRVSVRDMVIFSRQFSVLMGAKVPLVQALKTAARQTQQKTLRTILLDVAADVEAGTAFSLALEKHPKAFSPFFVNMVKSGETTGKLEEVMNYLADQMERDFDLMAKIKGAMTYPIFIIIGLVIVGFIMMTFVIPKLTESLTDSGVELPWTTKALISTSDFFKNNSISIVIAATLAGVAFRWWTNTPNGRALWDRFKLKVPIFGPLLRNIYVVRFTRSMGTLLSGGVDIPQSLDIVADVVGNDYFKKILLQTKKEVSDGNSITTVLARSKAFPAMVPQMLSVGEETGRLNDVFDRLTGFYSRELSNSVTNLVSAIEPLIMLVMGGAVGVMVSAILLPMYNMASQV